MRGHCLLNVASEVFVDSRGRPFRQKSDALLNRSAGWRWRAQYRHRRGIRLDDDLGAGTHVRQQTGEVTGRFRLRDVDG